MQRKVVMIRRMVSCVLLLTGCSDVVAVSNEQRNRTFLLEMGQKLDVTLYAPSGYLSPPEIASPVVSFLGSAFEGCCTPGGAPQRFSFIAIGRGTSTITFRRFSNDDRGMVQDTVVVR